ncbi:MAG TPA: glycosyltransferase [Thermoanaerobaculia bacterium]
MKIALVVVVQPTRRGGAEILFAGLERALSEAGHAVERIPVACDESTFEGILAGYDAARALDLDRFDLVVSTKAPSFNVRHSRHVVYLLHTVRVFYDLFDSWTDGSPGSRAQRDRIRELDFDALSAVSDHRRFAIGQEVASRLRDTLGLTARVLHPALPDADRFHQGPFEHFLHSGRLHPWKRADLVLEAYRSLSTDVPLLVTGTGEAQESLRRQAAGDDRIQFLGDVPREDLYDLYSRALAVPFVPLREDYGYVAVEAMLSGKPVITASDSGEPARLVEHEKTGLIVEPRADAIAAALGRFLRAPAEAKRMGSEGRLRASGIRWGPVVEQLLGSVEEDTEGESAARIRSTRRTRVLVVDNQPIEPPVGGGRIRLFGLYSNLPPDLDPVYVGSYDWPGPGYRSVLHGGRLREVTVPQSEAHFRAHESLQAVDPNLTMDITFPLLSFLSRGFADRIAYEARSADVIVFSHPWVFPIVSRLPGLEDKPFVYDSQNVEGRLRRSLLGERGLAGGVAEMVESLERELCRRAAAIFACSTDDARSFESSYGIDPPRIHVIPNGTDVLRLKPSGAKEKRRSRALLGFPPDGPLVVFVGSYYAPNTEAARFICGRLAPELPDVRFVLAGGCTQELARGVIPANVTALGVVDAETRDRILAAADIAINPMSRGSGTNIKMLDFLGAGLPTLTTAVGARGLGGGGRKCFLVAELDDFAAEIRSLLRSPSRRDRFAASARLLAESRFDWRELGASAGRVLRSLARREEERARPSPWPAGLRLAVLSTWNTRCGIADYTAALTGSFPPGADVRIYAEARSCGSAVEPNVRKNWEIGLHDLSSLEADLEKDQVQALLVQHNPAFFREDAFARLLQRLRKQAVPVAVTLHATQGLRPDPDLASELRQVERIYVHRRSDVDWLTEHRIGDRARLIPQGIPRLPDRSVEWVKSRIGLDGKYVIGHFGYLRPHKGVLELIEAFEVLGKTMPRAHLLLLCAEYPSADSGDYRRECEERIAASPVVNRIHASFEHLSLDAAGFLLQGCDVIVFPYDSSRESSSAAVRLAIASRRPIVVSSSGIFEELEGVAEVAPSREPEPLAAFLSGLAEAGPRADARERMHRFAAKREWSRISSFIWGDLRPLSRPQGDVV